MRRGSRTNFLLLLILLVALSAQAQTGLDTIDPIVNRAVDEHLFPGAVVVIGHDGKVVFRRAYGMRSLEPAREPMTADTIFDMASLTKPTMTALAVMQLAEAGKINVNEAVWKYLPEFGVNGKQGITIRQLLTHYSGLGPDLDLKEQWQGKQEAFNRAFSSALAHAPGARFEYSDINYITLGALVERVSGMSLDEYAQRFIIAPMGLEHCRYLPPQSWDAQIAPTQYDENHVMLRGTVHDPTARRMGGVAGHAGLFCSADDAGAYAQNLLDRLAGRKSKFPLSRAELEKMVVPQQPATGTALRGFGWDIDSPYSSNRGTLFPVGSFGHTGFTGTSMWIDPVSDTYVILLTNAVHPNGGKSINAVRAEVADAAAQAFGVIPDGGKLAAHITGYNESLSGARRWSARNGEVKTGIDVLEEDHFSELAELAKRHGGKLRVGLLTNQTGVDGAGRRTIDVLFHDAAAAVQGLTLDTIFTPEHGLAGTLDQPGIPNSTDAATGVPVVSLYGNKEADRHPTAEMLGKLDAVVIDLQDAGVRFYTYETAVRYFLEAAAKTGTEIVVLDRPDPINGAFVQGPMSDEGAESYVDPMPMPVRHGMTLGELAQYFKNQLHLNAHLTVVQMQGWERGDWFDSTGLEWVNPSPNLRSLVEATIYPALGLIETTNVSVGRGTDTPFELLGAPWIDGRAIAKYLNHFDRPGVRFVPTSFTPQAPYPYAGTVCHGVQVIVTDRNVFDAPETGILIASSLEHLYPTNFELKKIDTLLANQSVLTALENGEDPGKIAADWDAALKAFEAARKSALLYVEQ
ncbi:MAG TPA: exo-beta-N-acetylmuramidase NamZ domain-containing protein [Terracidiphilus sp.]|nr:exo-beta-N-acetylmuramidase NamZ domain-containing protein [Terracidiphilus sp.]